MISLFIFDVFINAIFSFFTAALLIELFLLFVSNPRLRYLGRLIPPLKLFIDLALYNYSNWALYSANPLTAAPGSRMITLAFGAQSDGHILPLPVIKSLCTWITAAPSPSPIYWRCPCRFKQLP